MCGVAGGAAAYLHEDSQSKRYSSTAELLFGANAPLSQLLGTGNQGSGNPTAVTATDTALASLPVLNQLTASALGKSVPDNGVNVSVAEAGGSNLVNVTATAGSPTLAARIANVYTQQFISYTTAGQATEVAKGIAALKHEIAVDGNGLSTGELGVLQSNLSDLETISAVEPLDVSIAQAASPPTSPSGPHPLKSGLLGLLIGAIVGFAATVLASIADPRIHSLEAVATSDLTMLLRWDEKVEPLARRGFRPRAEGPPEHVARQILASIPPTPSRSGSHLIVVAREADLADTSVSMSVAWDLACGFAQFGMVSSSLLLLLDPGSVPQDGPAESNEIRGWGEVLERRATVNDVVTRISLQDGENARYVDLLLPKRRHDPYLDDGPEFQELLDNLSSMYRYVVAAAPSLDEFGGAPALLGRADAISVVIELGRSTRVGVGQVLAELRNLSSRRLIVIGARRQRSGGRQDATEIPTRLLPAPVEPSGRTPV